LQVVHQRSLGLLARSVRQQLSQVVVLAALVELDALGRRLLLSDLVRGGVELGTHELVLLSRNLNLPWKSLRGGLKLISLEHELLVHRELRLSLGLLADASDIEASLLVLLLKTQQILNLWVLSHVLILINFLSELSSELVCVQEVVVLRSLAKANFLDLVDVSADLLLSHLEVVCSLIPWVWLNRRTYLELLRLNGVLAQLLHLMLLGLLSAGRGLNQVLQLTSLGVLLVDCLASQVLQLVVLHLPLQDVWVPSLADRLGPSLKLLLLKQLLHELLLVEVVH